MAKLISADLTNNKLCLLEYTTNDGKVLSLKEDAFDTKIVSHTYTDKGVVIFEKPITVIREKVFRCCDRLTSIIIPNSVITIGTEAFDECRNLANITIPDSVTKIGEYAFRYCNNLKRVTIGKSVSEIGEWTFNDCNIDTIVCYPKIPPKIYESFRRFNNLVVPIGCEEAYANSDWGQYLE